MLPMFDAETIKKYTFCKKRQYLQGFQCESFY